LGSNVEDPPIHTELCQNRRSFTANGISCSAKAVSLSCWKHSKREIGDGRGRDHSDSSHAGGPGFESLSDHQVITATFGCTPKMRHFAAELFSGTQYNNPQNSFELSKTVPLRVRVEALGHSGASTNAPHSADLCPPFIEFRRGGERSKCGLAQAFNVSEELPRQLPLECALTSLSSNN
jgi:hypothetical protein